MRQHTSAYVSIRQHSSSTCEVSKQYEDTYLAYVSIRQHTSAYVEHLRGLKPERRTLKQRRPPPLPASVALLFGAVRRLTAPRLEAEGFFFLLVVEAEL
jgi:hypothetical protein